jgi:curli production assembly/transport component CsgE
MRTGLLKFAVFTIISLAVPATASTDIELNSIIINQTLTRAGNEFFQRFSSLWEELPGQQTAYTVIVKEVPSVQYGSTISVELNDIVVYRSILRTRSSDVADAAMQAAQNARLTLLQFEQQYLNGNKLETQEELL